MSKATPTGEAITIQKIAFSLPKKLVERLRKLSPAKRTLLVKRAVERELEREATVAKFKRMRGKIIWKKAHHPDLLTPEDFAQYRRIKI